MIELLRYARVKPQGLVHAEYAKEPLVGQEGVVVYFKRFDVENGKEVSPETSVVTIGELSIKFLELEMEMAVVKELLALKPEEKNG